MTPIKEPGELLNPVTPRQREALNLDTEAQIASSAVVAAAAGLPREDITVTVPPNSAVLTIDYTAGNAAQAAAGARTLSRVYLDHRRKTAAKAVTDQTGIVDKRLKELQGKLEKAVQTVQGAARRTAARTIATQQYGLLKSQIAKLTDHRDRLTTATITPGMLISPPESPSGPSSPSVPLFLGSGLFIGLLCGLARAILRDRSGGRAGAPESATRHLTLQRPAAR